MSRAFPDTIVCWSAALVRGFAILAASGTSTHAVPSVCVQADTQCTIVILPTLRTATGSADTDGAMLSQLHVDAKRPGQQRSAALPKTLVISQRELSAGGVRR